MPSKSYEPALSWELDTDDFDPTAAVESASAANGVPSASPSMVAPAPTDTTTKASVHHRSTSRSSQRCLYLDLETVPDEERMHLFDLPPLPEIPPITSLEHCPIACTILGLKLDDLEGALLKLNPVDEFLDFLAAEEAKASKPRAGVAKAISAVRSARTTAAGAGEERRKKMSVTPEFCKIAAVGWAIGNDEPRSFVVGYDDLPGSGSPATKISEVHALEWIWRLATKATPIVGFNVIGFDLQVIRARSILLGVEPTRLLNDSPFSGNRDITDLMLARFGKGGQAMKLKHLARLYGIAVPAGDATGADVGRMLADDPAKVGEYVRSDVEITRALHQRWSGYFCV